MLKIDATIDYSKKENNRLTIEFEGDFDDVICEISSLFYWILSVACSKETVIEKSKMSENELKLKIINDTYRHCKALIKLDERVEDIDRKNKEVLKLLKLD